MLLFVRFFPPYLPVDNKHAVYYGEEVETRELGGGGGGGRGREECNVLQVK